MSALEQAMRLPDGYSTRRTSGDDGTGQGLVQLLGPDGEVLETSAGNAQSWRLAFARGHAKARAGGPATEVGDVARMRGRVLEIAQRQVIGRLIARLLGLPAYTDEVHEATLAAIADEFRRSLSEPR